MKVLKRANEVKAAKDFDKAVEGIMKKYGYTKTKD